MHSAKWMVGGMAAMAVALLAVRAGAPMMNGMTVFHYQMRDQMDVTGVEPGVMGSVAGQFKQSGPQTNQMLQIKCSGLQTGMPYYVMAQLDSDTNLTQLATFMAGPKGKALVTFIPGTGAALTPNMGGMGGGGMGGGGTNHVGGGTMPFPGMMNTMMDASTVAIANSSTQTVLMADLMNPAMFQFMTNSRMHNDGVLTNATGSLQMRATTRGQNFQLMANGLGSSNTYYMAVNGDIIGSMMSDAQGHLKLRTMPAGLTNMLDVSTFQIMDAGSNSVLSTLLP